MGVVENGCSTGVQSGLMRNALTTMMSAQVTNLSLLAMHMLGLCFKLV